MRPIAMSLLAAAAGLSACATHSSSLSPVRVAASDYYGYTCSELAEQMNATHRKVQSLGQAIDKHADRAVLSLGGPDVREYRRARGEFEAQKQAVFDRNCVRWWDPEAGPKQPDVADAASAAAKAPPKKSPFDY